MVHKRLLTVACLLVLFSATSAMAAANLIFDPDAPPEVTITPGGPYLRGQSNLVLTFGVRNFGDVAVPATAKYTVRLSSDGTCTATTYSLGDFPFGVTLPANNTAIAITSSGNGVVKIPTTATLGSKSICVQLPILMSTTANRFGQSATFQVVNLQPNLRAINMSLTPSTGPAGTEVDFDFDIQNNGTAAATAFDVLVRYKGCTNTALLLASYTFAGGLAAGATNTSPFVTFNIPANETTGNKTFCVVIDPGNTAGEPTGNRGDNNPTVVFNVTAPPPANVVPSNAWTPSTAVRGDATAVEFDLTNVVANSVTPNGTAVIRMADASATCSTAQQEVGNFSYLGNDVDTDNPLQVATTVTIPAASALGNGTPNKKLCIWTDGNFDQTDPFEVLINAPDIAPRNLLVFGVETTGHPTEVTPSPHIKPGTTLGLASGDTIALTFDVENIGTMDSTATTARISIHLDGEVATPCSLEDDLLTSEVTIPPVLEGQTESVTVYGVTVPVGTSERKAYKVCIRLDQAGTAGQPSVTRVNDWTDNTAATGTTEDDTAVLVVGDLPDLVPVNIEVVPPPPV